MKNELLIKWRLYMLVCFAAWLVFYPPTTGSGQKEHEKQDVSTTAEMKARIEKLEAKTEASLIQADYLLEKAKKKESKPKVIVKWRDRWKTKVVKKKEIVIDTVNRLVPVIVYKESPVYGKNADSLARALWEQGQRNIQERKKQRRLKLFR